MLKNTDRKYSNTVIATVSTHGGELNILDGLKGKRALNIAKNETPFCYVRDVSSKSAIRLLLVGGHWVIDTSNTGHR